MRTLAAMLVCAALIPAWADDSVSDHRLMMEALHITSLRPGADGTNKAAPNAVNYDESRVGHYRLPDPLRLDNGKPVTSPAVWWKQRRPQIVAAFDREMYGRVPNKLPGVHWEILGATGHMIGSTRAITERLIGRIDNSSHPAVSVDIQMDLTLPAAASKPVPVMIVLTWTGKWLGPPMPQGDDPDWREQLLAKGWGYAEYVPVSVQADDEAGLRKGIIGLVNKGAARKPDDWGVLRAWAWGVSKTIDYLVTDRRVGRIGVNGHSRYGKAALVAMAYDPRIAIGYISSSGAGGAKLLRRDFGERLENLAGEGEFHWMAGNFLNYAGPKTVHDLPVDAHELIALCAPRPVFIGAGSEGDQWVDQRGSFLAAVAAGPVYRLLGQKDLGTDQYPPVDAAIISGALGFRRHVFGHTPQPNWKTFLEFAKNNDIE